MLIRFSVSNYKSIKDKTVFSMVPEKYKEYVNENIIPYCGIGVLKAAAIYGLNESGKTNLFDAVYNMRDIVLHSTQEEPSFVINDKSFKLNTYSKDQPTHYEIEFILENVFYTYGFETLGSQISSEWLYQKEQRLIKIFERTSPNKEDIFIIKKHENDWRKYAELTRANTLFLSRMANLACDYAIKIRNWFLNIIIMSSDISIGANTNEFISSSKENKDKVVNFLKKANISINDIKYIDSNIDVENLPEFYNKQFFQKLIKDNPKGFSGTIIKTIHQVFNENYDGISSIEFDMDDESAGTNKLYSLAAPIIQSLELGKLLLIDEFDTNLHPCMIQYLFGLFNNKFNYSAQLVIITHSPLLMEPEYRIRRDQIWIAKKNTHGESSFSRVADYKIRKDKSISKSFLSGQFDKEEEAKS